MTHGGRRGVSDHVCESPMDIGQECEMRLKDDGAGERSTPKSGLNLRGVNLQES